MTWEIEAQDIEKVGSFDARWANYLFVGLRQGSNSESPRPPATKEHTWMAFDRKYRLYILLPLLFCCSSLMAKTNMASRQLCVGFRFDDPSATSNTEIEARLIEAFREHNMCCTWAIIPFKGGQLPMNKARLFGDAARAGVLEIALHGYDHLNNGLQERRKSEYVNLAYEDQLWKIQEGKKSLETQLGLSISVFVPPWNSYDNNTLRALEATQFRCLSANRWGWADSSTALDFLPVTCSIAAVKDAVIAARAAPGPNPVIVVGFHAYDFREYNEKLGVITFDQFIETLQWLTRQQDVRVVPMSKVSDQSSERYLANQRILKGIRWLPRMLHPHSLKVFLCKEGAQGARHIKHVGRLRLVGFYGGLILSVGAVAFFAAVIVSAKWPGLALRLLWLSGPVLLVCSLFWAFQRGHFGGRIRMLVAILAACAWCMGFCAAKIRWKKPLFAMK
ncbi:MAG: DUF2334 domain-containing protein [Planctomycetes bacterium]|nr:DUF2334 domain-containing protein [Planctomycetota bacterium]